MSFAATQSAPQRPAARPEAPRPGTSRPNTSGKDTPRADAADHTSSLVTLTVANQLCGVPVLCVRDILADQPITRIPLAPPEIAGSLNLRGRIVTAIDLRRRLGIAPAPPGTPRMSVVTEQGGDLYALLVDQVSEVMTPPETSFERNPPTLPPAWSELCAGIYRLRERLMVVLDIGRVLALPQEG
jgi:purine-binding chemotaxis protein CheW